MAIVDEAIAIAGITASDTVVDIGKTRQDKP
jgi:hypothetical protein